jgi:hypothetical protein
MVGFPGPNLYEWVEGLPVHDLGSTTAAPMLAMAAGLNGMVGIANVDNSGMSVMFSDGQSGPRQQAIPGTTLRPTCSSSSVLTCSVDMPTASGTCTGDGIRGPLALTETSDGAFWLAFALDHLIHDETITYVGGVQQCRVVSDTDRSTEEVVLMRLLADGSVAATTKWRQTITPYGAVTSVALASRGPRLYLAISENLIRTYAFDWANL